MTEEVEAVNGLAGVILAAGLSSRMGAYKPLLEVDGTSMIRRVAAMMRDAGADPVVVVTGHRRAELEAHLRGTGVEFVFNPDYAATQQLASLCLALQALRGRCRRVLISPADVPLVHPATVRALLAQPGDFVRPVWQGEMGHPVLLSADWFAYLCTYQGPGGLRGAMERSGAAVVDLPVEDRGTVLDNDTPADLNRLLCWKHRADQAQEIP